MAQYHGNKRKRTEEEEQAFAEFQLFVEFKRQRSQQTALVIQQQAPSHPPSFVPALQPVHLSGGWIMDLDLTSGRPFYVNDSTQQVQWDRPF